MAVSNGVQRTAYPPVSTTDRYQSQEADVVILDLIVPHPRKMGYMDDEMQTDLAADRHEGTLP